MSTPKANPVQQGDLLAIQEGIIAHQVNCRRVAGAGLAKTIAKRYPNWLRAYQIAAPVLGRCDLYLATPRLTIANLYGQDGFGRNRRYTDYDALRGALAHLASLPITQQQLIYVPYGLGAGLAGGDWPTIARIVQETIPTAILVQKIK